MKEGRKPEYAEKKNPNELQKMPHTKVRKFKSQERLEPALWHWQQAREADLLTVTPRVTPCPCVFTPAVVDRLPHDRTKDPVTIRAVVVVVWLLACLASQQGASISHGWIWSDNCTCCHTEIKAAEQCCYLAQLQ